VKATGVAQRNTEAQACRPLVSAIVPVYNGERFLAEALDSIVAQDYSPVEIIVVDDGSVDGTGTIAQSYDDVRYAFQANQGHAVALNTGLAAAQGDLLAFLDADDRWTPSKLSIQVPHLVQNPQVGISLAHTKNFVDRSADPRTFVTRDLQFTEGPLLILGAALVRREVFARIGAFDTEYAHAKDLDWFMRATQANVVMAILPQTLLLRRLHADNRSYRTQARTSEFLRVVKAAIDRKREDPQEV
jgi:glycosyltransferase involved in cell wall biosynthesis